VRKPEGRLLFGRFQPGWEDNIKIGLQLLMGSVD
jgi:hypothetical protein